MIEQDISWLCNVPLHGITLIDNIDNIDNIESTYKEKYDNMNYVRTYLV